jgi:hypothetical protein
MKHITKSYDIYTVINLKQDHHQDNEKQLFLYNEIYITGLI